MEKRTNRGCVPKAQEVMVLNCTVQATENCKTKKKDFIFWTSLYTYFIDESVGAT